MQNSITLKDALYAWETRYVSPESLWPHPSDADLQFADDDDPQKRRHTIEHIARCSLCADRYREMQIASAVFAVQAWSVIQRKAAEGEGKSYPVVCYAEGGRYKIEILQSSAGGDSGLIVLTIADSEKARYEGVEFMICDARGRTVLHERVVNGQAWQKIASLSDIDDRSFLVRPLNPSDLYDDAK